MMGRVKNTLAWEAIEAAKVAEQFGKDQSDCEDCDGFGRCWNNADPTSGQFVACEVCLDTRGHP